MAGIEQRNAKRVPVDLPASVEWQGSSHAATVLDISVGGVLMHCPGCELPEAGSPLQLSLQLAASAPPLRLLSRLVRSVQGERAAVAFEILDSDSERKLARFVQEQERAQYMARKHLAE